MSKQIKFKRYHFNAKNELIAVTFWGKGIDGYGNNVENERTFVSPSSISSCVRFIDCQYTNLKDKDGIEIYERDIIKFEYSKDQFYKGIVTQHESGKWLYGNLTLFDRDGRVLIGNRFENPELLK